MPSSRTVFDLKNLKSGVNIGTSGLVNFQKTQKCAVLGANFYSEICSVWCHGLMNNTHPTRHTSEIFENLRNRWSLFSPDIQLFKSNTERDEGISANSQTQHRRSANT